MNSKDIKRLLLKQMLENLEINVEESKHSIQAMKESRNSDTKSSAGDKYETGREMMQIEIDKYEMQLSKSLVLKRDLMNLNLDKDYQQVEVGSLVFTNVENYFISIGAGKLMINNEHYYAISIVSPMGQLLKHKKAGQSVVFNNKETIIQFVG